MEKKKQAENVERTKYLIEGFHGKKQFLKYRLR
jgi:hypothetical protein